MKVVTTAAVVLAALLVAPAADAEAPCEPAEFTVAPDGTDSGPGNAQHPWKTIAYARDQVRAKKKNQKCDIVVNVKAGDYVVDETIEFTEADSGENGHKIVYRSADGPGRARLLGARPVTGWEKYKDGIYKTKVDRNFYTLFEDGVRATTARFPNRRSDDVWAPYLTSKLKEPEKEAVHQWLYSYPGDWDKSWNLDNAQVMVWSGGSWSWFTDTVPIQNPSWDDNQLTLEYWTRYALVNSRGGSRYFLQNSLDFLDQPGEYYFDFANSEVYYWPKGSIDKVVAPTVKTIISLAGSSPGKRVHDVAFDGLALQYSDFVSWYRNGWISAGDSGEVHRYPEYDRQIEMPRNRFGMITLTNTRDIDLTRLHISDTGFTAVYLLFANERVKVSDSLLENVGADGIKVEGPYPGEGDVAGHNVFTDNYIHHIGELVPGDASGVELMNTGNNEVSHTVVKHSARYGVSLEVRPEVKDGDGYAHGNVFKYLRIEEAGLDSGDMGAFYTYGVSNTDPHPITNHVSQVVIGDVIPDASMPDSGTRGVHMDAGGCGFSFENIEVGQVTDDKYQSYQCNEVTNANWADGFDASKMEYDKIGVTSSFPYPIPS
ncbi:right-handed parallel beta-helix repeat-containing protein [Nonomuraea phyllanthi]|uniref:Right-handed parallel beta-helix repeat-containing protein n=1 Tax=Nonomuraea phyllanthi TaxID=2219224 RepID=A0A5C4WR50_9ACTN|nr:right-handed parallel beta-helix repeat-containing protein [Nonomuraea phyllanthi]KAB8196016.1 right-handed parallel beta-helix repeat-containing protein [Nonomuraea phyllanthi]